MFAVLQGQNLTVMILFLKSMVMCLKALIENIVRENPEELGCF